jgi:hypothetical protein
LPERATAYQVLQLGVEATPGALTAASKKLLDISVNARPNTPYPTYHPMGSVAPTTNLAQKEWSSASLDNSVQGYASLPYVLSSLLKISAPSTPSGATLQRLWSFKPANSAPDTFQTYTFERGSSAGAERFQFGVFNSATFRWTRTEASLAGALLGQVMTESITMTGSPTDVPPAPSDPRSPSIFVGNSFNVNEVQTLAINGATGTYVLTYDGQSTAPIAVAATTAAVQSALQGLLTIGANNVTVTGTPGTSYTITFVGAFAGVDASTLVLSAFTGGPPTIVVTTPGGMTRLTRVSSAELAIPERYAPGFTLNAADPSFSFLVQQSIDPTAQLVLMHDAASAALMADLRNRITKYCKILMLGPAVETLIGVPYLNSLAISFPFRFIESDRGDVDAVYANTYNMGLIYDSTFAGFLQIDVTNGQAAL